MEKGTQEFKRSVKGTLSAGMSSLVGSDGKKYYIIEFKFDSKTHHRGESKPVLVDEAFIGRDNKCQIRIDEEFSTVSREHAVIKKTDENTWTLYHRSQTNATYVNGQQVMDSVTLKNGDEIQLSDGGPRLGFILPQGEKAFVKSIGMSQRFNEFRKQALRPYRTALVSIILLFALAIGGLVWWQTQKTNEYQRELGEYKDQVDSLKSESESWWKIWKNGRSQRNKSSKSANQQVSTVSSSSSVVDAFEDYVYFVRLASITVTIQPGSLAEIWMQDELKGGNTWTYYFTEDEAKIATGFVTSDGYFVTARNVIEPWAYMEENWDDPLFIAAILSYEGAGGIIDAVYHIESKTGDRRNLHFREFTVNRHRDEDVEFTSTDTDPYHIRRAMAKNDYAYVKLPITSNLVVNRDLSSNIPSGTRLEILGFPNAMGGDKNIIRPQYTYATTSNTGLYHGQIPVTGANLEVGNSGGPVFCVSDGKYYVVGLVSRGIGKHSGVIVPMSQVIY